MHDPTKPQQSSTPPPGAAGSLAMDRPISPMDIDIDEFDMYESDFEEIVAEDLPPLDSAGTPDPKPPKYSALPIPSSSATSTALVPRSSPPPPQMQHPLATGLPLSTQSKPSKSYTQAVASGSSGSSAYKQKLCVVCRTNNVHNDGKHVYPTCGNSCAQKLREATAGSSGSLGSGSTGNIMRGEMSNPQSSNWNSSSSSTSIFPSLSSWLTTPSESRPARQIKMCEVCHQRPKHQRGGRIYPTCGLTCAAKLKAPAGEMCDFCQKRPKVVINGRMYPQCGKTCRDNARAALSVAMNSATCASCIVCWKATKMGDTSDFCSTICEAAADSRAPYLIELPRGHVAFKKVADAYMDGWKNTNRTPRQIKRIYMVKMKASSLQSYDQYRNKINSRNSFRKKANEYRGFLGLTRECGFGAPGNMEPCSSNACLLCCLVRSTITPEKFPEGIMTTALLPRATDMATNPKKRSSNVILMGKVILGKIEELDHIPPQPGPKGADSVHIVGHSRTGSIVDFQEYVVYDGNALQPQYLISFE